MFDSTEDSAPHKRPKHFKVPASYSPEEDAKPAPEQLAPEVDSPAEDSPTAAPSAGSAGEATAPTVAEPASQAEEATPAEGQADAATATPDQAPEQTPEEPADTAAQTQVAPRPAVDASAIPVVTPLPASPTDPNHQRYSNPGDLPTPGAPEPKHHAGKAVGIALGAVAVTLAAIYVGGATYFGSHYLPNTTVNGSDVSLKSEVELASKITEDGVNFSTTVSGLNLSFQVNGADIGLAYDGNAYAKDALSQQNAWEWPVAAFQSNSLTVTQDVAYDAEKLSTIVKTATDQLNATAAQPTNAGISYDATQKTWVITPDAVGTAVDEATVQSIVATGIAQLQREITIDDSALVQPTIKADDPRLASVLEQANALSTATIPLTVKDQEVAQVTSDQINGWLGVDQNFALTVNSDAVTTWAKGDLSKALDSVNTQRTYTRPDGKSVTVSGGTYGWNIDGAALAQTIVSNLQAGNTGAIAVPMKSEAETWAPGGQDWGKHYLDVDLAAQHVYFYDESGSVIWESDLVSGDPTEKNQTPEGVYYVDAKMTDQTLKGLDENHDNQPDYTSEVKYWMPFIGNLVAFHDASWRGSFGGTIYQGNGSHGCINLPASKAAELYNLVKVGDVVVTHQ